MNDERPIEKLLRRYANKRRDEAGSPPGLHPATRRLLQGEVSRQYPKASPEKSKPCVMDFFALLARRWVYAVSVLVVLGVSAALLLPSLNKPKGGVMLAHKAATEDAPDRESLATATVPPAEIQPTLAVAETRQIQPALEPSGGGKTSRSQDESATMRYFASPGTVNESTADSSFVVSDGDSRRKSEETKDVSLGMKIDSTVPTSRTLTAQPPARAAGIAKPADSPVLAESTRAGRADSKTAADGFAASRQAVPTSASVAAAPTASATLSDKGFVARGGGAERDAQRFYSQSYANVAPEQIMAKAAKVKAESPIVPVLANFQVQSEGNELRVIDSDGSTYRGVVSAGAVGQATGAVGQEAAASFERTELQRAQTAVDIRVANRQAAENYQWRVEGTNRTLNQNVVFTFNLVETTNELAKAQLNTAAGAPNQNAPQRSWQFPTVLTNAIINGRARLGPAQQIEVNAVPVKP